MALNLGPPTTARTEDVGNFSRNIESEYNDLQESNIRNARLRRYQKPGYLSWYSDYDIRRTKGASVFAPRETEKFQETD